MLDSKLLMTIFSVLVLLSCKNSGQDSQQPPQSTNAVVQQANTTLEPVSIDCSNYLDQGTFSNCLSEKGKLNYTKAGALDCMYMIKGNDGDHRPILVTKIHDYQNSSAASEKFMDLKQTARGELSTIANLGTAAMQDLISAEHHNTKFLYVQFSNLIFTLQVREYKEEPSPCIYAEEELKKIARQFLSNI